MTPRTITTPHRIPATTPASTKALTRNRPFVPEREADPLSFFRGLLFAVALTASAAVGCVYAWVMM